MKRNSILLTIMSRLMIPVLIAGIIPLESVGQDNPYKAPLYWSVYEHNWLKEQAGVEPNYIPESEWLENIRMVEEELKPYGYDMIAIDGWGDVNQFNEYGYRTSHSSHWEHDYAWWANYLQERGMNMGMYDNPLWINRAAAEAGAKIKGTDIPLRDLINYNEESMWFTWVQVDRPGAEEYVKGYVQHYADMGIKYLRVDFLSWFEDGYDKNLGRVGPQRPREHYETALRWMREACDENGMFLSLVMPHLKHDAELEQKYGHMIRINEDVWNGGWDRFSREERGIHREYWSQWHNPFDGYTYWSKIAGRGQVILDGDFIRINTMANDEEKKTVISLHLLAGGPLSPADQHHTIGDDMWVYQNEEMLALNHDGFVGHPLTNDPTDEASQIWTGQLSNGDWIIGLFNREDEVRTRGISFSELGISGSAAVRDLWAHADLGEMKSVSAEVPPHGVVVLRVSADESSCEAQSIQFDEIPDKLVDDAPFTLAATTNAELPVTFEVVSGPATVEGNTLTLSGSRGTVTVVARQAGDDTYCAALQQARSFEVTDPSSSVHDHMYIGGTFTGWALDIPMSLEQGDWVARGIEMEAGNHELKFANTSNWSGDDWGNASGLSGTASLSTGGAPNISFTIEKTGTFTITFNDQSLAYSIEDEEVLTSLPGSGEAPGVLMYPNPAGKVLSIRLEETFEKIEIVNALGVVVQKGAVNDRQASIDTSRLPEGMYMLRVSKGNKKQLVKKLIIKR